ncbi:MAG: DUF3787 domain-containing protein [Tissierellia bacterium]|nr:DUF3787 domain-containing protein [Tissierellia bacterium]
MDKYNKEKKDKMEEAQEQVEGTQTDIYSNTEYTKDDSNVAVPTEEAVEEAKEWVDDMNRR